jgi:hypothetical protein
MPIAIVTNTMTLQLVRLVENSIGQASETTRKAMGDTFRVVFDVLALAWTY